MIILRFSERNRGDPREPYDRNDRNYRNNQDSRYERNSRDRHAPPRHGPNNEDNFVKNDKIKVGHHDCIMEKSTQLDLFSGLI